MRVTFIICIFNREVLMKKNFPTFCAERHTFQKVNENVVHI